MSQLAKLVSSMAHKQQDNETPKKPLPRVRYTFSLRTGVIMKWEPATCEGHRGFAKRPVVGERCTKCHATTRYRTIEGDAGKCTWCSDGGGVFTQNDVNNFNARLKSGRPIDFQVSA